MENLDRWLHARSFHHSQFPVERLLERDATVSVCLPAREVAATIGPIVEAMVALRERGALDQVVVVDAGSSDGTAELAQALGAEVHQERELMPEYGPVRGKGDALWRGLSVLTGDVVCFFDSDTEQFGPHFARALVGAVACEPDVVFAKAFYRRPLRLGGVRVEDGGGRVTELTARPLLNMFYPELAAIRQPLAGELAGRRDLLMQLPFATGYAVEIGLLIDVYREVGLDGIAQVDLEQRLNQHQSLASLGGMAHSVLQAVAVRLERDERLAIGDGRDAAASELLRPVGDRLDRAGEPLVERPPMREALQARARAAVGAAQGRR